jgi:hypothetical protein
MNDQETKLLEEVKELRAEIRRLRHFMECACVVAALILFILCPTLLGYAVGWGVPS